MQRNSSIGSKSALFAGSVGGNSIMTEPPPSVPLSPSGRKTILTSSGTLISFFMSSRAMSGHFTYFSPKPGQVRILPMIVPKTSFFASKSLHGRNPAPDDAFVCFGCVFFVVVLDFLVIVLNRLGGLLSAA